MSAYIYPFSSKAATPLTAGGKGANLAALTQAQFPVPSGFIITTQAYQDFVSANAIQAPLLALLKDGGIHDADGSADTVGIMDAGAIEDAAQKIARLFDQAEMPNAIQHAIREAYQGGLLSADAAAEATADAEAPADASAPAAASAPAVAVRSSATAEDLPGFPLPGSRIPS